MSTVCNYIPCIITVGTNGVSFKAEIPQDPGPEIPKIAATCCMKLLPHTVTKWSTHIVTKWPPHIVTKWPPHIVTKWPPHTVTKWPPDKVTKYIYLNLYIFSETWRN